MRITTFLTLLGLSLTSWAGNLTERDIQTWLSSVDALNEWSQQRAEVLEQYDVVESSNSESVAQLFSDALKQLKQANLYNEFNKEVKKHGFRDADHWSQVSQIIALGMVGDGPQVDISQLEAQLKQIEESDLSKEEKEQYSRFIRMGLGTMKAVQQMPAEDKALVARHRASIEAALNH